MSISNHNVDVNASTADLEAQLASYEASLEALNEGDLLDDSNLDTAEWLESGIELIDGELAERESRARASDLLSLLEFTEGEINHVLDAAKAQGEVMTTLHHGNARVSYQSGIYTVTP